VFISIFSFFCLPEIAVSFADDGINSIIFKKVAGTSFQEKNEKKKLKNKQQTVKQTNELSKQKKI
jgi:hypothetical protein